MSPTAPIPGGRRLLFWALAATGCIVDLGTKHYMFSQPDLLAGGERWLWPNHVGFQLSLNQGALFGMGQGAVWLFAACSMAAAVAIPVWLFALGGAQSRALTAALGCIMGGVVGNLFDRLGLSGLSWADLPPHLNPGGREAAPVHAVRDFVLLAWRWPPQPGRLDVWPNFNVADSLLVCGAAMLVWLSLRQPQESAVETSSRA